MMTPEAKEFTTDLTALIEKYIGKLELFDFIAALEGTKFLLMMNNVEPN